MEKNILLAAASKKFLRVIVHMGKKVIAGGSRRKFSGFISSFGKKKLSLAATGEKILGVIFHMVKKLLLAAAGEFFLGYCSYGKKDLSWVQVHLIAWPHKFGNSSHFFQPWLHKDLCKAEHLKISRMWFLFSLPRKKNIFHSSHRFSTAASEKNLHTC